MKFRYISFFFIILLILFRYLLTRPVYKNGDFVRINSKVYSEPIVYERQQYLKVQNLNFYLPKYPEIIYGDKIIIEGLVDGNKLKNSKLIGLVPDEKGILLNFRQKIIAFYKSSLPEPMASLVAGIVIGSKNMPESFWKILKSTGTAHVVVASGTNVTMTINFLIGLLIIFLKRRIAILITLVGILAYVIISGFDAPIVRAGVMGSILLIGQEKGRVTNSWTILIYSCLIMLFIKPSWLTDLGFILSFTATISLMIFQKSIDLRLKIIPAIFREGLSTSLAAQVGVAPIIYMTFGQFNLLSPIINALILWTIPYIMILGVIGGVVGLVIPLLGKIILYLIYPLLYFFVNIVRIFS